MKKAHGNLGKERSTTKKAVERPLIKDIAWAAGFYEGDGNIHKNAYRSTSARITQVNKEPLNKMLRLFGGSLSLKRRLKNNENDTWNWAINGSRCRGFVMTIYPFLSERRKRQILNVLY